MKFSENMYQSLEGKCPKNGYILAYTRSEVIFRRYNALEDVRKSLCDKDVLEFHLFDRQKEYRVLASRSARYKEHGYIEAIIGSEERNDTDEYSDIYYCIKDSGDDVYCQETLLDEYEAKPSGQTASSEGGEGHPDKISGSLYILNHIRYDETGMAVIDNYRMYVKEGENA